MSAKNKRLIFLGIVFVGGVLFGIGAKYLDTVSADGTAFHDMLKIIGQLLSELPFWVFIGCVIAYYSRTSNAAALHLFLFFTGMLISYYIYSAILFGFLPIQQLIKWAILAAGSALGGYIVWYAGKKGWPAALCAAMPIGYLISQGYPVYYTYAIKDMAALVMAAALYVMLPRSKSQKLRVLPLTALVIFVIVRFDLVSRFFGGL